MWTFIKGFAHKTEHVHWTLSSGPGKANGLNTEDGLAICLYPAARHQGRFFTVSAVQQMLEAKAIDWLRPTEESWFIDLEKVREIWPQTEQHSWLHGSVSVKPNFIERPSGVFATDAGIPVLILCVTIQNCLNLEPAEGTPRRVERVAQTRVDEDIELLKETNSGAFGVIWEGRQKSLERKVAVKVIRDDKSALSTALQHAKALAKCSHPNVVTVHSVGKVRVPITEQVVDAVVMEWIEGTTLSERLESGNMFSASDAKQVCTALIAGIRHIHQQGIAHGDLHSRNVMMTHSSIKLIDIDFSRADVLTRLTSHSLSEMVDYDLSELRILLRRVITKSNIDVLPFNDHLESIRLSQTIDSIADAVSQLWDAIKRGPTNTIRTASGVSSYAHPIERPTTTKPITQIIAESGSQARQSASLDVAAIHDDLPLASKCLNDLIEQIRSGLAEPAEGLGHVHEDLKRSLADAMPQVDNLHAFDSAILIAICSLKPDKTAAYLHVDLQVVPQRPSRDPNALVLPNGVRVNMFRCELIFRGRSRHGGDVSITSVTCDHHFAFSSEGELLRYERSFSGVPSVVNFSDVKELTSKIASNGNVWEAICKG